MTMIRKNMGVIFIKSAISAILAAFQVFQLCVPQLLHAWQPLYALYSAAFTGAFLMLPFSLSSVGPFALNDNTDSKTSS